MAVAVVEVVVALAGLDRVLLFRPRIVSAPPAPSMKMLLSAQVLNVPPDSVDQRAEDDEPFPDPFALNPDYGAGAVLGSPLP